MNNINLSEVLRIMDKKAPDGRALPFDISVRTFSAQNQTGGNLRRYNESRLLISTTPTKKNLFKTAIGLLKTKKRPNHFWNRTRNIELANGEIKKLNILFIVEFNGKKVVY